MGVRSVTAQIRHVEQEVGAGSMAKAFFSWAGGLRAWGSAGTQIPGRDLGHPSCGGQCWGDVCARTEGLWVQLQQAPKIKALEGVLRRL